TNWVGKAGQGIQLTGTQLSVQSEAGYRARHGMPDPVLFDAAAANRQLNSMSGDPLGYAMQAATDQAAYQRQLAAQQQAAHVVQTYDNNLGGASTSPAFATPPEFSGGEPRPPIITPPPHDRPGEHHGRIEELHRGGNDGGGPTHGGGSGASGPRGGGPPPGGGPRGGGKPEGGPVRGPGVETITDDPVGGGRPIVTNPAGYNLGGPGGGGLDPVGGFGATGSTATRSSNEFGGAAPIAGGFGGQGDFGADTVRGGSGLGGNRPGGSVTGGRPGVGGAPGSAETSARPGAGPGAAAAGEAAMRSGAAGRPGATGMGGVGAGPGGRGGGDSEHKTASYLVESDTDDLFGTDQLTAPPVIGE
ncbi:MAG: hypothetical protein ACRDQ5_25715, partial [Sciscionella sp.]